MLMRPLNMSRVVAQQGRQVFISAQFHDKSMMSNLFMMFLRPQCPYNCRRPTAGELTATRLRLVARAGKRHCPWNDATKLLPSCRTLWASCLRTNSMVGWVRLEPAGDVVLMLHVPEWRCTAIVWPKSLTRFMRMGYGSMQSAPNRVQDARSANLRCCSGGVEVLHGVECRKCTVICA